MRELAKYRTNDPQKLAISVNELIRGRSNAVRSNVTLTANAGTTVVTDVLVGPFSRIFLFPKTASAAAQMLGTYISSVGDQTYTITHPNTTDVDKTFFVLVMTGEE